jgi:hypothetical protein
VPFAGDAGRWSTGHRQWRGGLAPKLNCSCLIVIVTLLGRLDAEIFIGKETPIGKGRGKGKRGAGGVYAYYFLFTIPLFDSDHDLAWQTGCRDLNRERKTYRKRTGEKEEGSGRGLRLLFPIYYSSVRQ